VSIDAAANLLAGLVPFVPDKQVDPQEQVQVIQRIVEAGDKTMYGVKPGRFVDAWPIQFGNWFDAHPAPSVDVIFDGRIVSLPIVLIPNEMYWGIQLIRADGRRCLAAHFWDSECGFHWHSFKTPEEATQRIDEFRKESDL